MTQQEDIVEDGFGTAAPAICSECGCRAVYVCRPGDIRCGVCYDNNPKEWYTGLWCSHCGMRAVHSGVCLCCNCDALLIKEGKMDWRPENWEEIVTDNHAKNYDVAGRLCLEAGADAMMGALRAVHSLEGFERMTEVILKPDSSH